MSDIYEDNRQICKYVHATSRGHEAIQLATAFQMKPADFISPYYRDDSLLLGLGFSPYILMLQLLAKREDIFSAGREYYAHPSYRGIDRPTIIHQSSATGMQAIPATGIAQGIQYLEKINSSLFKKNPDGSLPVVVCSLGDASLAEGEVSEAFQVAALKKLPVIYLVQDNDWGISVTANESRTSNAAEFAQGFKGLRHISIDGSDFPGSFETLEKVVGQVRGDRSPYLVHAKVPLLTHHTSGVRKEFYRSQQDLAQHAAEDPLPKLRKILIEAGINPQEIAAIESDSWLIVSMEFAQAVAADDPDPATIEDHIFASTPVTEEVGERAPQRNEKVIMVDAALFAIREIMEQYPEAVFYGQDVGRRLGGVFREAATLAEKFGDHRVYNTAIQEAYIIGSTVGMAGAGVKPIVEVQFGDYIFPGINQLVSEVAKSCYLSCGKFPVQTVIRVPVGAYGGGGPYHSGSVETMLLAIKGIKVAYPSNSADMKGLMKAAFLDPNPVLMLEHKGLYWGKVSGAEEAKCVEPSGDYILPLGKANLILLADEVKVKKGMSVCIVTYGMGVYWAKAAAKKFAGQVEIVDLRTLFPLDEKLVFETVKKHGKCLVLTEEQQQNSFAEALASRISNSCFRFLDAPVEVLGALNLPAVPLNVHLEHAMLPNPERVSELMENLLSS
jgi:2-oxoisovalerate dehydrogenase E1 component